MFFTYFSLFFIVFFKSIYSKTITFTIYNHCDVPFQPLFQPSLPGYQLTSQGIIKPNGYNQIQFDSNDYHGFLYAPIKGSQNNGQQKTTHGEFDIATGKYAINLVNGYNVGLFLQLLGKQAPGPDGTTECDAAKCDNPNCQDAFHQQNGLLSGQQEQNGPPMHQCPPDFTQWMVYFCPTQEDMNKVINLY